MKSKNVYSLPFEKGTNFIAGSDPHAHYGHFKHAIDFRIDFNVPILAPLDGEIWNVKDDSNEGGDDKKYGEWKYQNLITIKHSKNEYSQYIHLAHKSALVKIGDIVKKGDPIAKGIGMVGWTTAPHLHMMVFNIVKTNEDEFESLDIQFDKRIKIIRDTVEYCKELTKSKYKGLKELEKKYSLS
jgi:murein DD-endopeptidase MepM/ murein hydrolase activator NlpD